MDRRDVVAQALEILGQVGLPDLTMRRLGTDLGVQQSALYHHFANKQALLGAVADEILARGPVTEIDPEVPWPDRLRLASRDLRAALLAYPDGADVVSSMFAFELGGGAGQERILGVLAEAGWEQTAARHGARTLVHFVHGHAVAQQAHESARRIGAITGAPQDFDAEFAAGVDTIVRGLVQHG